MSSNKISKHNYVHIFKIKKAESIILSRSHIFISENRDKEIASIEVLNIKY